MPGVREARGRDAAYLEVKASNENALGLYCRLGYEVISQTDFERLDVVTSDTRLHGAEIELVGKPDREHVLARALNGSASLTSNRLQSQSLKLGVSGSAKVRLGEVQAGAFSVNISGSGDIEVTAGVYKGVVYLGIYELDGDTLRICFALPDRPERPTDFSAARGTVRALAEFKRVKD